MKQTSDKPLTYQEAFKIQKRICKCSIDIDNYCNDCPLSIKNNGKWVDCDVFLKLRTELAEPILKKWVAEHPTKTNRDKFIEVFGKLLEFEDESCDSPCLPHNDVPWRNGLFYST